MRLYEHQLKALPNISNGCILCGGVGSGKSITSLAYYYQQQGGVITDDIVPPKGILQDLYIITTAQKRDKLEWDLELIPFLLSTKPEFNIHKNKVTIDSWNNLYKYSDIKDAFFIFDEQRVVGYGAWVTAFLKITKKNNWLLLSATPGDTWMDYVPVFIANGFFKNKTEFTTNHVRYSRYSKFPKVEGYYNTGRLIRLRERILVDMDFERSTVCHDEDIISDYNLLTYKSIFKNRWNPWSNEPIKDAGELCYSLRRVVNSDMSREKILEEIVKSKKKVIVFYNFNYELDILKNIDYGEDVEIAEWNGHKHQEIPRSNAWVYLVQYTAGAEGWNCILTNTIVFYSQNYSYKTVEQARGRINRLNTPYVDLYYYHLKSKASIDIAISRALKAKKKFNEVRYASAA